MSDDIRGDIQLLRDSTEGNPRMVMTALVGDRHLGGQTPGILDAITRGILKQAGENRPEFEEDREAFMEIYNKKMGEAIDEFIKARGRAPTKATVAQAQTAQLEFVYRALIEEWYGHKYRALKEATSPSKASDAPRDPAYH